MGMWSLMGNEACSKCLEPHPCTISIPAASFLPEIWDGFLAALSVPTLPICDPCYMTVATFYLQWQLKRCPCSTAVLFSCWGSRHGCREGRDWACASWYFRAGQGYSHSIPRLVTMVNIQQVIWLLTHPHPYTECIPVQSEQSFWSHRSTLGREDKPVRRGYWLPHFNWGLIFYFCPGIYKLYNRPWMEMMENLNYGWN